MDGFEPIASYDKPRLIAEMVLDNELTMRGVQRALFGPERLTWEERQGLVDRLKEAAGGTSVGDALVDIATNPFVWLGVAFSGAHSNRLDAAIRGSLSIFAPRIAEDALHAKYRTLLGSIGLLTPWRHFEGTAVAPALDQAMTTIDRLAREDSSVLGEALRGAKKEMGLPDRDNAFDPRTYSKDNPLRRKLEDFHNVFHAYGTNMYETRDRLVPQGRLAFVKELPDGTIEKFVDKSDGTSAYAQWVQAQKDLSRFRATAGRGTKDPYTLHYYVEETGRWRVRDSRGNIIQDEAVVDPDELARKLTETGARPVVEAWEKRSLQHLKQTLGKDGVDGFVADANKIRKALEDAVGHDVMAAKLSGMHIDSPPETLEGLDLVSELLSGNMEKAVGRGWVSKDHYKQLLTGLYEGLGREGGFVPLNVTERVHPDGSKLRFLPDRSDLAREASGRVLPRTRADTVYPEEDLESLKKTFESARNSDGMRQLENRWLHKADMMSGVQGRGEAFTVHRVQPWEATSRYLKDMAQVYALRIEPLREDVVAAHKQALSGAEKAQAYRYPRQMMQTPHERIQAEDKAAGLHTSFTPAGLRQNALLSTPIDQIPPESLPGVADNWREAFNVAHVIDATHTLIPNPELKRDLTEVILPAVMGRGNLGHILSNAAWNGARRSARWFVDSSLGRFLERNGHSDFVQRWREALDNDLPLTTGGGLSHAAAKFLYTTHLGFNLGSVVLNMFQPLVLGGTVLGPTAVLQGYGHAVLEMLNYARDRVTQHGLAPITDTERLGLMQKHFKFLGETGIGPNVLHTVDTALMNRAGANGAAKSFSDMLFEYSMKLFEKSEWLNRTTMAHATEIRFARAGRPLDPYVLGQVRRVVEETQFPAGKLDQPTFFLSSRFMSNPLVRQFFTYNLRAFTAVFDTLPRMLGQNYWAGLASSMARGMGISAVTYELGKNLLGADISHGLYADSVTGLVGGGRFFDKDQSIVPLPPALDIPVNLARGLAGGDIDLIGRSLSRLVPGGIALSRALGTFPKVPGGALGLQRTYVDWSNPTPDGLVPVFKSDGSLIDYRPGSAMILRSLGADLGKWQAPGELDNYLVNIRDEALQYRSQYLQALKSNNIPKAKGVQAEYEKRFKLPLTVTGAQVKQSISMSEVPRAERALNRMPQDQRAIYSRVVQRVRGESALGLPEGALTDYSSAAQRTAVRQRTVAMDQKTQDLLRQLTGAQQQPAPPPPFAPFVP